MYKEFNPNKWQVLAKTNRRLNDFDNYNNDVDKLIETVELMKVDISQGYENWRNIAFALIDEFGASGRSYFHRLSKLHSKYDYQNCDKCFDEFLNSKGSGITIRSLFWIAKQNGVVIHKGNQKRLEKVVRAPKSDNDDFKEMKFPVHVFPDTIAEFVRKSAEAINCPEDFIAIPMLSCFAMAMSNKRVVRVKKDWQEFAILYAAIVSQPGTKKSPALNKAILPLKKLQNDFSLVYQQEKETYDKEFEVYENEQTKWKSLKKEDRANTEMPRKPILPNFKQVITSDATIEAIMEMFVKNNSGVLCYMDELAGWIKGMNQYKTGGGNDLEKWLLLWSAILQIINRKGQEPVFANNPFVNVVGGIQPDVLDVLSGKDNGLIDRVLFAYPEEITPLITDIEVSEELDQKLCLAFERLYAAHSDEIRQSIEPEITKLSKESYLAFKEYVNNELYKEMTSYQMPYYLRGAWAKFPGYIARFALIIQGMNYGDNKKSLNEIDLDSLNKAIEIAKYFMAQAKKVYAKLNASKLDKQVEIAEKWINKNGGQVGIREFYTNKVAACKNTRQTMNLFEEMVDRELGNLISKEPLGGGRTTFLFVLENKVCNRHETQYNFD